MKTLVMSVGPIEKNGTCKFLSRIGASGEDVIVCLPYQFKENAGGYENAGYKVFLYDESKYINEDFEFFGFKPRNCGGIGRQGVAEALDKFGDGKTIFLQLDDDTAALNIRTRDREGRFRVKTITKYRQLAEMMGLFDEFYERTGIKIQGMTGVSPPSDSFIQSRKTFNNFIMRQDDSMRYTGFKSLVSDDCRYNIMTNLVNSTPTVAVSWLQITFKNNQGDRDDGNAVIYNEDYSWKKAFGLKMITPLSSIRFKKETNRFLFREHIRASKMYPRLLLEDKNGKIVGEIR